MRHILIIGIICLWAHAIFAQNNDTLLPASENGKWGYINTSGKWVIQPIYERCHPLDGEPYSWVSENGRCYLIDSAGNIDRKISFNNLVSVHYPIMIYREKYRWGWYQKELNIRIPAVYSFVEYLNQTKKLLIKDTLFGVASTDGSLMLPTEYDEIYESRGFYRLTRNQNKGVANDSGKIIVPVEFEDIEQHKDFFIAQRKNEYSIYSKSGQVVFTGKFKNVSYLLDEYFFIAQKKKALLVNAETSTIHDSLSSSYIKFDNRSILQRTDSILGLYSVEHEKPILPKVFGSIELLPSTDLFLTRKNGLMGVYDRKGKEIIANSYELINPPDFWGAIPVRKNNLWGLMDSLGNQLLPCEFFDIAVGQDRVVKARAASSILMIEFDSTNKVLDSLRFKNVSTMYVNGRIGIRNSPAPSSNNQINPALLSRRGPSNNWFQDTTFKWGLRDTAGNVFIKPIFDAITKIPGTEYVLCIINSPYTYTIGPNLRINSSARYALVDEVRFRKMTPPSMLYIDTANVSDTSLKVFRALGMSGFFETINKRTGRSLRYASKYIGPYSEGRAPILFAKSITSSTKVGKDEIVITTPAGYVNMVNLNFSQLTWRSDLKIVADGYWGYLDENGRYIKSPVIFKQLKLATASPYKWERAIVSTRDSTYAVLNKDGDIILDFDFSQIYRLPNSGDSLFVVQKKSALFGYIDTNGRALSSIEFVKADPFQNGYAWARYENQTVLLNQMGDMRSLQGEFKTFNFSEGIAGVAYGYRYALYDTSLTQLTDYLYSRVGLQTGGLIPIRRSGRYGYIDLSGNYVINPDFLRAESFSQGLAVVKPYKTKGKRKYGYINTKGQFVVSPQFIRAESINEKGYAEVRGSGGRGIVGKSGKVLVPTKFRNVHAGNNRFVGDSYMRISIYDQSGRRIKRVRGRTYGGYSDNKLVVKRNKYYGVLDTSGKVIMPFKYRKIMPFENGITVIRSGRLLHVIDDHGDTISSFSGRIRSGFADGLLLVKRGSKYQYLTPTGRNKFGLTFDHAKPFEDGLAIVTYKGRQGLLDNNGFFRIEPNYSRIENPENGVCVVSQQMHLGICDLNSKFVVPPIADEVVYVQKHHVFRYTSKNRYGYFERSGKLIREAQ